MSLNYDKTLIPYAKKLRREMTRQEKHLWYDFLSGYPVRFQRQKTIDRFIADFYCHKAKLIIELDDSRNYTAHGTEYNDEKTAALTDLGLRIIRFSSFDIDKNFDAVCWAIDAAVLSGTGTPTVLLP